ncbi:hypothetical protein [Clostridium sp.]|uniref:hypothetical protein n=1 Tax=Clostridium sp. TaxID=1506 RepID=UPI0035A03E0E
MEEIKEILLTYRKCTINIIKLLEKDDFSSLQSEIDERQYSLNSLISFERQKEEAKEIYRELGIEELQTQAEQLMRTKSLDIKKKLGNISKNKRATNAYGGIGSRAVIFSKKI